MNPSTLSLTRQQLAETPGARSADVYRLPQVLDLTAAANLRDRLTELLNAGSVELDASLVERASTPCLQVLLAGAYAAEATKTKFWILDASDALRTAVVELGLQSRFTNWMP